MKEFRTQGIAAIGWPRVGNLSGCDRDVIKERLRREYYESASAMSLGQATGIGYRFVRIKAGDGVAIPDGDRVYFGVVTAGYEFKLEFQPDALGYPHQMPVDPGVTQETKERYVADLAAGAIPGINSPRFELAVQKVLGFYFPELRRLSTTDSPPGADTDLKTEFPGGIVIRIQVKCFQENAGPLGPSAVAQLRNSMEPGEHGILVTTNSVEPQAMELADSEPIKPIGIISGREFAELVFENLGRLTDADLWTLGLRRQLTGR